MFKKAKGNLGKKLRVQCSPAVERQKVDQFGECVDLFVNEGGSDRLRLLVLS